MKLHLVLLIGLTLALTGCSRSYVLRMTNGTRVTTSSKPKLDRGYYVYTDPRGEKVYVPQGRVLEISPASRTKETKSFYKP